MGRIAELTLREVTGRSLLAPESRWDLTFIDTNAFCDKHDRENPQKRGWWVKGWDSETNGKWSEEGTPLYRALKDGLGERFQSVLEVLPSRIGSEKAWCAVILDLERAEKTSVWMDFSAMVYCSYCLLRLVERRYTMLCLHQRLVMEDGQTGEQKLVEAMTMVADGFEYGFRAARAAEALRKEMLEGNYREDLVEKYHDEIQMSYSEFERMISTFPDEDDTILEKMHGWVVLGDVECDSDCE